MSERSETILTVNEQAQSRAAERLLEAVGGLAPASSYCRKSEAQLSKYSRTNYAESMPIAAVEDLEAVTHGKQGHPHVTRYLADKAGFTLFKKPQIEATGADMLRLVADQSKEGGDIASVICHALADGKIQAHEIPAIRKEVADLIRLAVTMDAELDFIEQAAS